MDKWESRDRHMTGLTSEAALQLLLQPGVTGVCSLCAEKEKKPLITCTGFDPYTVDPH